MHVTHAWAPWMDFFFEDCVIVFKLPHSDATQGCLKPCDRAVLDATVKYVTEPYKFVRLKNVCVEWCAAWILPCPI